MVHQRSTSSLLDLSERGMRLFRIQLIVAIVVYTVAVYTGIFLQSKTLLTDSLRTQGESYFDLVYHTRAWNARYGGAWVSKTHGAKTNVWLSELGVSADTITVDGEELTLRNPSSMTREISELTREDSGVTFHLTDNDALNPENLPDDWEAESLEAFARGVEWTETFDRSGDVPQYRYMQPLTVDSTCITCHTGQTELLGEAAGGVSITIPITTIDTRIREIGGAILVLTLFTIAAAIATSQWALSRLWLQISETDRRLEHMAVTDELTGLSNRRSTIQRLSTEHARARRTRSALSLIVFDIDHFKSINDTLGHATGDAVLREVGVRLRDSVRAYDSVGRIGGEEFLVIAPDTDAERAALLAERILERMRATPFVPEQDVSLIVTMSAGVATSHESDADCDALMARADTALYVAKESGRNRVAAAESPA